MRRDPSRPDRGAALIFALGILACLTLLATAFATLTQIELRASHNYRDGERATYVAVSGLERAKFELRRSVTTPGFPLPWLVYEPKSMAQTTIPDLDLGTNTQDPSFKYGFAAVPAILQKNPAVLPYPSGFVGSTYYHDPTTDEMLGDYYVLRVTDANALVYLNDENPHLGTMLDNLAWALQVPTATNLGARVLAQRPAGGFRRIEDVKGALSPAELTALKPYLTVHAYVDRKVIEMGPQAAGPPGLVAQPRAPIDVNLAPMPVLVAALAGVGYSQPTLNLLSQQKALLLANEILAYRAKPSANPGQYGFASWAEFAAFLKKSAQVGSDPLMCSAILANANPNTDLNKFVPDSCMYHPVDKTDLAGATTELRFGSGGVFVVESLGVILGPDGTPVAASKMRSTVRVFDEYVETTQADFEVDRLDPNGVAGYPGLRDITTGPEWRNAFNANLTGTTADEDGLLAARYDGHLTFNAIASTELSPQGGYAGFIDRTVEGAALKNVSGSPVRALVTPNAGPLVPNTKTPDWQGGTDLLPLGAFTGRGGRSFAFNQDPVVPTVTHDVPKVQMSTSPIDYILSIYTQNVTPQWSVDMTTNPPTAKPLSPIVTPNPPQNIPQQLPAITELVPAWSYESVDKQGFELWFKPAVSGAGKQELLNWASGDPEIATQVVGQTFYWGKKATLAVWLEPDATPPQGTSFTVHCRFTIEGTPYSREWIYGSLVRAGTWHHVLFSFFVPKQGQEAAPPEQTLLFVDGNDIGSTAAPQSWPTYTNPQALAEHAVADDLIAKAQAAVVANGITGSLVMANPINLGDPKYQIPVQFPRGDKVYFAGQTSVFHGIVDNIIVQGNWAKKMPGSYGSDPYCPRFDSYRPSAGGAPSSGSELTFQKRAQALEWDRPIRVVACDVTAWKSNAADDGGEALLGDVFLRFGWMQQGTGSGSFPQMSQSYPAGSPSGWTPRLNGGTPFNAVASGFLVPDRGQNGGAPRGFLTKPGTEVELYGVEITPTTDAQPGPRMAPIVDDVRIVYMAWDVVTVLEEVEIVD